MKLSDFLKEKGFMCYVSNPCEEDYSFFLDLQKRTGNKKMKFTPYTPICYEKQLSQITSLIIEGVPKKNVYYYDFYKITFYPAYSQGSNIKIYGQKMTRNQLMRCVHWVQ
jgi:hypothetical protein